MKTLKLEVGKTYRSRSGEEVRIVENDNGGKHPYQGNNGVWYTESGRFHYWTEEHPEDLIEEVPSETRHTFAIPDGVKKVTVAQEGNRIVVEMVQGKGPKPGDVMINDNGNVYIFKEAVEDSHNHFHYAGIGRSGRLSFEWTCALGRPATPEEAKPLFDALKKAGKRWNPETMQVEDVLERERIMGFLQRFANNIKWSDQQLCLLIEAYLKYRN